MVSEDPIPQNNGEFEISADGVKRKLPTDKAGDFSLVIRDAADHDLQRIDYSVTGYGGTEECYSMPGQALWVMWPDYDTVNVAKDLIAQVMAGQTPVIPED